MIFMVKDEWLRAAMVDDVVVAELLLRLKQSEAASVPAKSHSVPLKWGMKRPRSRLTAASRCGGAVSGRKDADSARCSPTTPLSWSGGASPSATADSYEESSRLTVHSHRAARSKAAASSDYIANSASAKKCKRKKTFADLKEEESFLLKERIYLRKEIANANATFKAEIAKNESLKRMKLDVDPIPRNKPSSTSDELLCTLADQLLQRVVPFKGLTHVTEEETHPQAVDSKATRTESTGESVFLIPDLNMMPSEDDCYTDAQCGVN